MSELKRLSELRGGKRARQRRSRRAPPAPLKDDRFPRVAPSALHHAGVIFFEPSLRNLLHDREHRLFESRPSRRGHPRSRAERRSCSANPRPQATRHHPVQHQPQLLDVLERPRSGANRAPCRDGELVAALVATGLNGAHAAWPGRAPRRRDGARAFGALPGLVDVDDELCPIPSPGPAQLGSGARRADPPNVPAGVAARRRHQPQLLPARPPRPQSGVLAGFFQRRRRRRLRGFLPAAGRSGDSDRARGPRLHASFRRLGAALFHLGPAVSARQRLLVLRPDRRVQAPARRGSHKLGLQPLGRASWGLPEGHTDDAAHDFRHGAALQLVSLPPMRGRAERAGALGRADRAKPATSLGFRLFVCDALRCRLSSVGNERRPIRAGAGACNQRQISKIRQPGTTRAEKRRRAPARPADSRSVRSAQPQFLPP